MDGLIVGFMGTLFCLAILTSCGGNGKGALIVNGMTIDDGWHFFAYGMCCRTKIAFRSTLDINSKSLNPHLKWGFSDFAESAGQDFHPAGAGG